MIETICNSIQLAVLGIGVAVSVSKAIETHTREWILSALFFAAFFLGDLYWELFLILYGQTPTYFYVSETGWYSGLLFLDLLLIQMQTEGEIQYKSKVLWVIPAFAGAMAVFYMTFGDYLINIVAAIIMSMLLWRSIRGLKYQKEEHENTALKKKKLLLYAVALLCAFTYCTWTASCFWNVPNMPIIYSIFDLLASAALALILLGVGKAVS